MTEEKYSEACELQRKIRQCEEALQFQTNGTVHKYQSYDIEDKVLYLPEEVCVEMRNVIAKYKEKYEKEFEAL